MKRKIEIEFKVTPEEIAELFLDMTAEEQARFFNECSRICIKAAFDYKDANEEEKINMPWKKGLTSFSKQMEMVVPYLTIGGELIKKKFSHRR